MSLDDLADQKIARTVLTDAQVNDAIATLGARWAHDGGALVLSLAGTMTFTGQVAAHAGALADELDHHPSISLSYPGLRLAVNTHDARAITALDVIYGARLERWLRAQP